MTHRRLTELEIQLLGLKLSVADIIADDNEFARAASALIGGDNFHPEDFKRVVEEAYLIAEHRLANLDEARDQPREQRSDGGEI